MAGERFSRIIDDWVNDIITKRKDLVIEVRKSIGETIIDRTPVRTGRAKGGWRGKGGEPSDERSVSKDISGEHTKQWLGEQAEKVPINVKFFITNNVPYIGFLESGTSTQAPSGMVAITAQEFQQAVRKALNDIN